MLDCFCYTMLCHMKACAFMRMRNCDHRVVGEYWAATLHESLKGRWLHPDTCCRLALRLRFNSCRNSHVRKASLGFKSSAGQHVGVTTDNHQGKFRVQFRHRQPQPAVTNRAACGRHVKGDDSGGVPASLEETCWATNLELRKEKGC